MATTPNLAWPLPDETDVPDVPSDMTALADAIDSDLWTIRFDAGIATGLTATSAGLITVPHNLGAVPIFALAMVAATQTYTSLVGPASSFTDTDFGTYIYNLTAGAVSNGGTFNVRYIALAAGVGEILDLSSVQTMLAALAAADDTQEH